MEAVLVAGPGSGMVTVTGRWNFLLRGSSVTTGDSAPPCRASSAPAPAPHTATTLSPTLISLVRARPGKWTCTEPDTCTVDI